MQEKKWAAATGKPGRIVAARVERGEDLINSIIELIKENDYISAKVG